MESIQLQISKNRFIHLRFVSIVTFFILIFLCLPSDSFTQTIDVNKKLKGFDQYMDKILKDWNVPGIGVGIVYKDKLVFSKGYGYRDYGKKLPITPNTLFQIASNTKLFTAVSIGMLVEQGKLEWDKPVHNYVPSVEFYNNELTNSVTIRDMLAHRTGITRHDMIWYKSDFSRKDLFERLKYLEPIQPLRQGFIYNNMMYVSAGYIIELLSSKKWENFVQENLLNPLDMKSTVFTVDQMEKNPDHGVPYNEKRDTTILYEIPIYKDQDAVGPAGAIISNINDMSKWLIALMNNGKLNSKAIIPEKIIKATLEPTVGFPNTEFEQKGYKEIFNTMYGMGRGTSVYRGHLLTSHGGDLPGFHSQISYLLTDSIGVIVFVIGDQGAPLYDIVTYNIYERLLGVELTPWSERVLKDIKEAKRLDRAGRNKAGSDQIKGTMPSHALTEYVGQYENPAYGIINITLKDSVLNFDFHNIKLPLKHYQYDRFDTPNDEQFGLWSLNFTTNPQGSIDALFVSLDEKTTFTKKVDATLSDPATLSKFIGKYEYAGNFFNVELSENDLYLIIPGQPKYKLLPVKQNTFRVKEFVDITFVFVIENNEVTTLKQIDPSGEYLIKKVK